MTTATEASLKLAREWLRSEFGSGTHDDDPDRYTPLAYLLDRVRAEALEEAAKIAGPKRKRPKLNYGKFNNPINRDSAIALSLRKETARAIRALIPKGDA